MEENLTLGQYQLTITAESIAPDKDGFKLSGSKVIIELPFLPDSFYLHGWQSWSLTTWLEIKTKLKPSLPEIQRSRTVDPLYALDQNLNGSWVGAVRTPDGNTILFGALGLESHVRLEGNQIIGSYESGRGDWFLCIGSEEAVFQEYSELLVDRFGRTKLISSPRVWCSWYNLFTEIDESILLKILDNLDDLPFDVIQIDDGWQKKVGDWEPNEKFPSGMQSLAEKIKATGRKAGLWLAPLLVVPSSSLFQNHPDWLLRDDKGKLVVAGVNWLEILYALDTSHPQVLEWLRNLMHKVREWGFEYVKLDFLYAGALPGKRHINTPRETAFRQGLAEIRSALGDAYLLTCGAPIIPAIGLCDAIRIGTDISENWNLNLESRLMNNLSVPGIQNAIRNTLNRLWLKPLVHTDPDVVFFHASNINFTPEQKALIQNLAHISDFKASSDLPNWLTETERQDLKTFLTSKPEIQKIDQYTYKVDGKIYDYSNCVSMPQPLNLVERLLRSIIGNLVNNVFANVLFEKFVNSQIKKTLKSRLAPGNDPSF